MSITASTYFEHLKAYVNDEYVVHDGTDKKVILKEKYFRPEDVKPQVREIELGLPGAGLAFKLDSDDLEMRKESTDKSKKGKPALFHFLDDTSKPWSKRCDFVVFYVNRRSFHADCIEFKSKSLTAGKIVPQLKAGASWVSALKKHLSNTLATKSSLSCGSLFLPKTAHPTPIWTPIGSFWLAHRSATIIWMKSKVVH